MKRWNILLAMVMLLAAPVLAFGGQDAAADPIDSPLVVKGRLGTFGDDYRDLTITVSQTKELVNQAITVSWTGGQPTREVPTVPNSIGVNYLQLMQCWGDPEAADDPQGLKFRETCQWGGATEDRNNRRSLMTGDPMETLPPGAQMVPFVSGSNGERTVDGTIERPFPGYPCPAGTCPGTDSSTLAPYFSNFTTNEIYQATTGLTGIGQVSFEVQTAVQSPHLGCGNANRLTCWLVIMPRGERGPAGPVEQFFNGPLAASFWQDRIVVPLEFLPRTAACPVGVAERRTVGTEFAAGAIGSWQPAMCSGAGRVFGYTPIGDTETARAVRSQAEGGAGLGFTLDPVITAAGMPSVFHAPVALNSAVIAFNIDTQIDDGTAPPEPIRQMRGSPVKELNLTPLIVARLLTQYYQRDVPGGTARDTTGAPHAPHVKDNPQTLRSDPDFLAHNDLFNYFPVALPVTGLMVIGDNSVAAREVWRWVLADPQARAFLSGPGVNPYYAPLFAGGNVPPNFPKDDPTTFKADVNAGAPYTTANLRPPVDNLRDGARQTLRADARSQVVWDTFSIPNRYRPQPPTEYGKRFALTITDAASAARYGLPTAKLRNRAGEFTGSTSASLLKAVENLEPHPAVPQVLAVNPAKATPGAYPLPMLTYAAMDGGESTEAKHDYAELIRYATGSGQTPGVRRGELPMGYVPLPNVLRLQALAAATQLEQYRYVSPAPQTAGPAAKPPAAAPPPPPAPPPAPKPSSPAVYVAEMTKPTRSGNVRYALAGFLVVGALALLIGPMLRGRRTVHAP